MNFRKATRAQLYEIAYNDTGCSIQHKLGAVNEIKRRDQARQDQRKSGSQIKLKRKRA